MTPARSPLSPLRRVEQRRRRRRRRLLAGICVLAVAVAAPLAFWLTQRSQPPPAGPAAAALAAALTTGHLDQVRFKNVTRAAVAAAWRRDESGMAGARATVAVVRTDTTGARAIALLRWTWRLPSRRPWTYVTRVALRLGGGRWEPLWSVRSIQPGLRAGESLRLTVSQPPRAAILSADGRPLIAPRPVVNVGIEPDRVRNLKALARKLHVLLGVAPGPLVAAVRAASPTAFVPVITLRRPDYERLRSAIHPLPGTVFTTGTLALAPTRTFARSLLGTVGPPTAQMLQASPGRYVPGETVGLSGLEQAFDARLAGRSGVEVQAVNGHGRSRRTLYRLPARRGAPLRTTLEIGAQEAADAAVAAVKHPVALVAIRITTGAVIASSVGPDPGGYDIAFQGEYPPGSTFKVVTALALLEGGEQPTDTIACPKQVIVDGKRFHNAEHEVLGTITFTQAFAASCNTAFVGLSSRVPGKTLPQTARSLGLGVPLALGVPAFAGVVPAPTDAVDLAAEAFGQGRILVSPLAMAGVAAAVARGRWLPPTLIENAGFRPPPPGPPLPSAAVETLRSLMRDVVTGGTGTALASQPGLPVYGKTGTAEYGSASPPRTDAWFIAYQGDVAVAALVAGTKNGFGGSVAAPIVGRFLATLQP